MNKIKRFFIRNVFKWGTKIMKMWTKEHAMLLIPAFAVMIALSILLGYLLRNKEEKYRMIPIQIISVILLVLGVIKQVYYLTRPEGYDMFAIPAHFCSLALFFLPIFAFYKGKYKGNVSSFTFMCCSMLMVFMIVYPDMIYSAGNIRDYFKTYSDFHTVTFHTLVCFVFVLIIALKLYDFDTKRDMKIIPIWFTIFCIISATMAQILKTNYNSFYDCNIDAIETIRVNLISQIGWWGQLIFVLCIYIVNIMFAFACYWIVRGVITLANKIKLAIINKSKNRLIG